jgi:hypothetical protein
VDTLTGVGRIHRQAFIATHAKGGFATLDDRTPPITAADLLYDRGLPLHHVHGIRLSRVLRARGTEHCGAADRHERALSLAVEDIDHTRTKVRGPPPNGLCERFHQTVLDALCRVALREQRHGSREALPVDLDAWLRASHAARPHGGRWCCGKTPMQTFLDRVPLAKAKLLVA